MRADPQPAGPATQHDLPREAVLLHRQRIAARRARTPRCPSAALAARSETIVGPDLLQPLAGLVRDVENRRRDRLDAQFQQQIEARPEAEHPDHVLRAALVAGRRRLAGRARSACSRSHARRCASRRRSAAAGRDARGGCTRCPLPRARASTCVRRPTENRSASCRTSNGNAPEPLNRVEHHQRAALVGDLDDPLDVVPIAGRVADPAHRDDPRPRVAGRREVVEIEPAVVRRHAPRLDAATRQVEPRIRVRRKLVGERHHIVARPPVESLRHQADARRRVRHQRDLVPRRRRSAGRPHPASPPTRRDHSGHRVSPSSSASSHHFRTAAAAGRVIGATAAWSKYAHCSATGIWARSRWRASFTDVEGSGHRDCADSGQVCNN